MKRMYMIALIGLVISVNLIDASAIPQPIAETQRSVKTPEGEARLKYLYAKNTDQGLNMKEAEEFNALQRFYPGIVPYFIKLKMIQ